jgi:hypothetical protein
LSNDDDIEDEVEIGMSEIPEVHDLVDEDDIDLGSGYNSAVYELKFSKENIQFMIDGALVKKVSKSLLKPTFSLSKSETCIGMAAFFRRKGLEATLAEYMIAGSL